MVWADMMATRSAIVNEMPPTVDRRPYEDDEPDGYVESDTDWARNNWEAVRWLADNHKEIRAALPNPC